MLNKSFKACVLVGSLVLWTGASYAAGLGKLTVTSALGQRFRAEIDLVSVQKDELSTLAARLASPEAFKNANLEYANALGSINLAIDKRPNGQPFIKLTSSQPIEEPILDILVELSWASGRLVREYTALIDPVEYAAPPVAPIAKPETKTVTTPAPRVSAKIRPAEKVTRAETPAAPSAAPSGDGTHAVKSGDTLVKIARANAVEGISLEQMLVGLYQNNQDAFAGKNINRLKAGKILRIPDRETLAAVEPAVAVREVKAQAANWNAYRQKLAGIAAAAAPTDEGSQSASGKISASVEDKGAVGSDPNREVLKLSKGEDRVADAGGSSAGAGTANVLQDRVRSLEEEATARERALQEANERVALLEDNVRSMQRLLELRNESLAQTQAAAAAASAPKPAPTAAATAPVTPETQPAATSQVDPQLASPAATPPVAAPAPGQIAQATLPLDPPAAPEVSLIERLLGEPLYLAVGALAIGLIGFAVFRRRRSQPGFENSIMTGGDLTGNTVFGNSAAGVVDTNDSSLITDFGRVGLDHIATDEVDPVAEAEVYIAYGRDAQAEEILKEALEKNPQRFEIHLKLLEIYAARLNVGAFETLAGELYAATGGQGETWAKAAAIGLLLEPENPLYANSGAGDFGDKAAPRDIGSGSDSAEAMEQITKSEFDFDNTAVGAAPSDQPTEAGHDIEFESHKTAQPAGHTELPAMDFTAEAADEKSLAPASVIDFDFDLGPAEPASNDKDESIELRAVEEPIADAQSTPAPMEEPMFDFDLEPVQQKVPELVSADDRGVRDEPALVSVRPELKDIDLGFSSAKTEVERPEAPVAKNDQWYDVQTKFDLAKAYQEMGDNEGAREILQEVVQEGDAEQQANSKALLASLG